MKSITFSKSIRGKIILRVTSLLGVTMLFATLVVGFLIYQHMNSQIDILLYNKGHSAQQHLEQRIKYLVDNSEVLAKNELLINSLLDAHGRQTYLPTLAKNFMQGKDVVSLSILDFDGRPIFQTQKEIPRYDTSSQLRSALSLNQTTLYLENNTNMIVAVVPIQYYATTQGALVVVFNIKDIATNATPKDEQISMRLYYHGQIIYNHLQLEYKQYQMITLKALDSTPNLGLLEITTEVGVLKSSHMAPVRKALLFLGVIGLLITIVGLSLSVILAESISNPIVELYRRINSSSGTNRISCYPIGTDDELEVLAQAFDKRSSELEYLAKYDTLTKLPNRVMLIEELTASIDKAKQNECLVGVIFFDLDHFKEINDSLGHKIGDELLKKVGGIIQSVLGDNGIVSRIAGDEFVLMIDNIETKDAVEIIAQKLISRFNETIEIEQLHLFVTPSLGIALYPDHGSTADELIKNADTAMYRAKTEGRNTYFIYTEEMTKSAFNRMNMQTQIHRALKEGEFMVYYQPQVDMLDNTIVGMEALIRWRHPKNGMIPPDQFIPLAEETGQIIEIDRWVMKTAMMQFSTWINEGYNVGKLALNLSMVQLKHGKFIEAVQNAINDTGIPTSNLQFEVTETQIMKNPEEAISVLKQLKLLGISLAIDDFGTGHSSLAYLKRLPLDKLKIDKSFIDGIPYDNDDTQLTRTIISMALNLNLELIAEGVETQEQAQYLVEHKCTHAQGYLYYRPMGDKEITDILRTFI